MPDIPRDAPQVSLENWLMDKLHFVETMHDYAVATDTIRCWIDEYKGTMPPSPQDLREMSWMLFNELDDTLERPPKKANWFGNVDHIKQNVNLLKKEFQFAAEVAAEKDNRIIALQESEMRLIDANSRQEQRIAELEKQIEDFHMLVANMRY